MASWFAVLFLSIPMSDHTYLYQLNEALRGGGLGSQGPLRERYALEQYLNLASKWVGEDLRTMGGDRVRALNTDREYPYWFAYFRHACEGAETDYLMVEVKEPWYYFYLNAMEDMDTLPPDDGKVQALNVSQDLAAYIKTVADIKKHSPLN